MKMRNINMKFVFCTAYRRQVADRRRLFVERAQANVARVHEARAHAAAVDGVVRERTPAQTAASETPPILMCRTRGRMKPGVKQWGKLERVLSTWVLKKQEETYI